MPGKGSIYTNNSLNNGLNCLSAKIQSCNPRNWQNSKSQDCTKRFSWVLSEKSVHNRRFTKKTSTSCTKRYNYLQTLMHTHTHTHSETVFLWEPCTHNAVHRVNLSKSSPIRKSNQISSMHQPIIIRKIHQEAKHIQQQDNKHTEWEN